MALQCVLCLLTGLARGPDVQHRCVRRAGGEMFADGMQALEERQRRERPACRRRRRFWRHQSRRTCLRMARSALRCRRPRPCMLACLLPDLTCPAAPAIGSQGERPWLFIRSSGSSDDGRLVCCNVCVAGCACWHCWAGCHAKPDPCFRRL